MPKRTSKILDIIIEERLVFPRKLLYGVFDSGETIAVIHPYMTALKTKFPLILLLFLLFSIFWHIAFAISNLASETEVWRLTSVKPTPL